MFNCFPKGGRRKKMKIMKTNEDVITMLQYQIKRYQTMGNGAMCQTLQSKLHKLITKQRAATV